MTVSEMLLRINTGDGRKGGGKERKLETRRTIRTLLDFFFFFWLCLYNVEVPRPRMWPKKITVFYTSSGIVLKYATEEVLTGYMTIQIKSRGEGAKRGYSSGDWKTKER